MNPAAGHPPSWAAPPATMKHRRHSRLRRMHSQAQWLMWDRRRRRRHVWLRLLRRHSCIRCYSMAIQISISISGCVLVRTVGRAGRSHAELPIHVQSSCRTLVVVPNQKSQSQPLTSSSRSSTAAPRAPGAGAAEAVPPPQRASGLPRPARSCRARFSSAVSSCCSKF